MFKYEARAEEAWEASEENQIQIRELEMKTLQLEEQSIELLNQTRQLGLRTKDLERKAADVQGINDFLWEFISHMGLLDELERYADQKDTHNPSVNAVLC